MQKNTICCLGILPMKQKYREMHAMVSMEFKIMILYGWGG